MCKSSEIVDAAAEKLFRTPVEARNANVVGSFVWIAVVAEGGFIIFLDLNQYRKIIQHWHKMYKLFKQQRAMSNNRVDAFELS